MAIDTIGQFGIGLLSGFVVAERIDVYTQKAGDDSGWHWVNHGNEDYELAGTGDAPAPGTRVVEAGFGKMAYLLTPLKDHLNAV